MLSVHKARSLKASIKSLGAGPKCSMCDTVAFLRCCARCLRMACTNHYGSLYKSCFACDASLLSASSYEDDTEMASRWGGMC